MKCLIKVVLVALAGSLVGSAVRQLVLSKRRDREEGTELVIAASPVSIGAGVIAGLLVKGHRLAAAFLVAANVGANVDSEAMARIAERLQSGD
ncbi:MAG: hypothetical protein ACR2OI_04760 [Acidimicrobiia bacterium]